MAWVNVIENVEMGDEADWRLCFQKVVYNYNHTDKEEGFRFIWKTPENRLQPARGQARIPDEEWLMALLKKAQEEGWFKCPKASKL